MRYIPQIIHFIWFGRAEFPPIIKKCLDSWKRFCPDYEFMFWNEDNFDININDFVKEAYENKKWAFVSDYARLYVLYTYGGVYADSDCEIVKSFDTLLENEHVITGYSTDRWIPTAFLAAEKENVWIKKMLDYYENRHFVLKDGRLDLKPNNAVISEISEKELGFRPGKDFFIEYGNVRIYQRSYFHPYKKQAIEFNEENLAYAADYFDIDENTYCIHYSVGVWDKENEGRVLRYIKHTFRRIMPKRIVAIAENFYYRLKYWGTPE